MPRFLPTTVRTRFILGMGIMLLPLVVLAAGALFSLQSVIRAFDEVVQESSAEMALVDRLQLMLRKARNVIHDYFIPEFLDTDERLRFLDMSLQVEKAFEQARAAKFEVAEAHAMIRSAEEEWRRGHSIGQVILAVPNPVTNPTTLEQLARLDAHFDLALDILDRVHSLTQGEMTEELGLAYRVRRRAVLVVVSVFSVGLAIVMVVGRALARSILQPVRVLEEGAARFGAGDLSHRVSLDTQDELGQLGGTFNAMAEKLATIQKELEHLSIHDGLTGLFNYREFHRRLTGEVQRSRRYGRPFSLLILDIDGFKVVNDTHGHLAGDEALRAIVALVRGEVRPVDEVARYGGEEFAILLPETAAPGALMMAERLREIIATRPITIGPERTVALTVSIGVATYPEDAEAEEKLIAAADRALYAAKNAGRNRVCRWSDS